MTDRSEGEWFAPKQFGVGAGPPVSWQGWAVLGGYVALTALAALALLPRHQRICVAVVIVLTLGFTAIAVQHTRGGWRWRWGGKA